MLVLKGVARRCNVSKNIRLISSSDLLQERFFPNRQITSGLQTIFEPKSIAIVGATDRPNSVGRTLVNNLLNPSGQYKLYPVNPSRKEVLGIPCFSSIADIPDALEMAVIVTPANTCVDVMKQCAAKGVKSVVIISAGFKEAGPAGVALENEIVKIGKETGIRIIGPNCVGVMNPNYGMNATFASCIGLPGNLAFISQSGAMCTAVLDWSMKERIGFSSFISIGSMADVNWGDMIDYLGNDPTTDAILIYMESIGDAQSFLSAAKEVSTKKPIVVIKAGKSDEAATAAASHTGSLVGSHIAFEAAMKKAGVLTVNSINELFNVALILGKQPLMKGGNLMIVTNAGGPGVLATDATVLSGAKLAKLSPSTMETINKFLPAAWSRNNPVDILGDASADLYAKTLEHVLNDDNADGVLVVLSPQDVTEPTATASALVEAVKRAKTDKPIIAAWMGAEAVSEGFKILSNAGIPTFSTPDEAATTFGALWKHVENQRDLFKSNSAEVYDIPSVASLTKSKNIIAKARQEKRFLLTEAESKEILSAYGIEVVETVVARTVDEAIKAAERIGGNSFAVKLDSKTLTHKSDVGGVLLNVPLQGVADAYKEIEKNVVMNHGSEHFNGVTVQEMLKLDDGIQLILGSILDSNFGPLMLFGSGGTYVEIFGDTMPAIPPLDAESADRLMKSTKIFKALQGGHGKRFEGVNLDKLKTLMIRFSNMIQALGDDVKECDINPVLALKDRFVSLDARMVLKSEKDLPTKNAQRPFPLKYVSEISLRKRNDTLLRPLTPSDVDKYKEFQSNLNEESVRSRYLENSSVETRCSREKIIELCYPDFSRIIPIGAFHNEKMVGLLEVEHPPTGHSGANLGQIRLVLSEEFQGRGLGSHFLNHAIQIAREEGLNRIYCYNNSPNENFDKLMKQSNFNKSISGEGVSYDLAL